MHIHCIVCMLIAILRERNKAKKKKKKKKTRSRLDFKWSDTYTCCCCITIYTIVDIHIIFLLFFFLLWNACNLGTSTDLFIRHYITRKVTRVKMNISYPDFAICK